MTALLQELTYKHDISDVRETPALDVLKLLHTRHASAAYVDQFWWPGHPTNEEEAMTQKVGVA